MAIAEFFNSAGEAVCYLQDDSHIFDWDGRPSAYIRDNVVYLYSGQVAGWLHRGWIYDKDGGAVLFIPEATGGPMKPLRKLKPLKSLRKLKPLKSLRQAKPAKPVFKNSWSAATWDEIT